MIRYLGQSAIETICSRRLKISEASKFNDPYELLMNYESEEMPDDWIRKFIDKNIRVLCVSDPARLDQDGDILMWSHYGQGHTGYRLHLDRSFLEAKCEVHWDVEYESIIPRYESHYDHERGIGAIKRSTVLAQR